MVTCGDLRLTCGVPRLVTVQARVSSVSLILFLPYLMTLMEFFTKNMPEQQPEKRPAGPPTAAAKP